jgi:hypothetical protein
MTVTFGVLKDFKGGDTLLICADDEGLTQLRAAFDALAGGQIEAIQMDQLPWAKALQGIRFHLSRDTKRSGAMEFKSTLQGPDVHWSCSQGELGDFSAKLEPLLSPTCESGHQYLDVCGYTPLQVIVSKGEYPPDYLSKAFSDTR